MKISHILLIGCHARGNIVYVLSMIGYKMDPLRARSFDLTINSVFFLLFCDLISRLLYMAYYEMSIPGLDKSWFHD